MPAIDELTRSWMPAHLRGLTPYDPAFSATPIVLSANENPFGVPDELRPAMERAIARAAWERYPDPLANDLRDAIASWYGVRRANVLVCNGGDEAIFNFLLAFGGGATMLNCPPTFEVYELYGSMVGVTARNVWRDPETLRPDWDELLSVAPECDLAVLTTPNNPTGDLTPRSQVEALLDACPGPVLIDEAYGEFTAKGDLTGPQHTSALPLLASHPNLVILHTLSKAFGMAGLRVGYVIASEGVVAALASVRQPYSVNSLSAAAAEVAVRNRGLFEPRVRQLQAERDRLYAALSAMGSAGVRVWPSAANFLLVRLPNAGFLRAALRDEHGILVRDFSAAPGLADCLRISVGTPEQNDALLGALSELLGWV